MRVLTCLIFAGASLMPEPAAADVCPLTIKMETAEMVAMWRSVNDGVMGGLSSGGPRFAKDHMSFAGVINTNGGGFSSIRAQVARGAFEDMTGLKLRVKSDGRIYKATFRTDARVGWREVSFQAPLPVKSPGQWEDVIIDFSDLAPSVFGRPVRGAEFNPMRVQSVGIILADGQDGPFRLGIAEMSACKIED